MNIKPLWQKHPLYKEGKIELVPMEWVLKYSSPNLRSDIGPTTKLMNNDVVDMHKFEKNLLEEGMHDPLIIRIGIKNKKMRLETGNHRVHILHKLGFEKVPVTVEIKNYCGPYAPNTQTLGSHNFDIDEEIIVPETKIEYINPRKVFKRFSERR